MLLIVFYGCSKKNSDSNIVAPTSDNKVVPVPPVMTTALIDNITDTTAVSGGAVIDKSNIPIISRGVCWSTSQNPSIADNKTIDGSGPGAFISVLTGLTSNTVYHLRAYATNTAGTVYGNGVSFTTGHTITIPNLTTTTPTAITQTTAVSGGTIFSDGGSKVTARGVCWNTSPDPSSGGLKTDDGAGVGTFSSNITGLLPNTTYYIRAYATNRIGTAYGTDIRIATVSIIPGYPSITTLNINLVRGGVTCGGKITSDGGNTITSRGICWSSTTKIPTLADLYLNSAEATDSFRMKIPVQVNTTYYMRAFATNSIGTTYGGALTITTPIRWY